MKQLFGTDGIRGHAGNFPLDATTIATIGRSLTEHLAVKLNRRPRLVTGRDTRESGSAIEAAFHAGCAEGGAEIESAAVITTPGVAYLTKAFEFDAGIVISASHNPYEDNGIKVFTPSGQKLDEATERAVEADVYASMGVGQVKSSRIEVETGRVEDFHKSYVEHLIREANGFKTHLSKVVIDCANGAASQFAHRVFADIGAELVIINDHPDGRNINAGCGSLHLDQLQLAVEDRSADLGIAFDGDADRALFVDDKGSIVDGDGVMWVMAQYLKDHGKLANDTVISTVMSNIGLEIALNSAGLTMQRTSVGDKYVLERLLETGASIGGEQSGHVIFPAISLVGDGMMTAMLLLRAIGERKQKLSEAVSGFVRYPQILVNVNVREKRPFNEVPAIAAAAEELTRQLNGQGRLLLRYSGTENLARVMIEGKDQSEIEAQAHHLASVIKQSLGQ